MGNEPNPNSPLRHLPGILVAATALVAAVSTLYVNLRGPAATPAPVQAPAKAAVAAVAPSAAQAPAALVDGPAPAVILRLDRVLVENDGSMGTTDWTFEVSAANEPRFTLPMRALNDKPGHNLARPSDPGQAQSELMLAPDQQLQLQVKGWKEGLLGGGAEIAGSAWISGKPGSTSIHVGGDKPKGPAFTLYFVVAPKY